MKKLILSLTLFLVTGLSLATERISLNGTWQFALAKDEKTAETLSRFYEMEFDDNLFTPTPVPSNWTVLGYEEPTYRDFPNNYGAEGFYFLEFDTPVNIVEQRSLLHFGGVWSSAEVWLNGQYLGRHESGYTSFAFEISGQLTDKGKNRLAVRVRQTPKGWEMDAYDDWRIGGIYRDVEIETMPRSRWIDRVVTQTRFDDHYEDADLNIRVMVSDQSKAYGGIMPQEGPSYELSFRLDAPDGREVACRTKVVEGHPATDRETNITFRLERPLQWTAETPNLYRLTTTLKEEDGTIHERISTIGIREISTNGGVFRINGKSVKLRGVNRHDEHPDVGRATRREHWLKDIKLMKEANINFVRTAHYAPAEGFIELCDSMGLYVGEEISIGGGDKMFHDPLWNGAIMQRVYETVMRDICKPSVIYWSIGNEDPFTSIHLDAARVTKGLDPSRPILYPWRMEEWLPREVDILAPHYWQPEDYDRLAASSNRPIISTEYTHAYGTIGMGGLDTRWKTLTQHATGAGAAIWMWADQGLKTPHPKLKVDLAPDDEHLRITEEGWDGIVDSYRRPTADYWEVKAVYAPVCPAVSEVTFTPGEHSVVIPISNKYDFTDLRQTTIEWTLFVDAEYKASGRTQISGSPHTTNPLTLPLTAVKSVLEDQTVYVKLKFTDVEGFEIGSNTVELVPRTVIKSIPINLVKPIIKKNTHVTIVTVADYSYEFNNLTGELTSIHHNNKPVVTGMTPVIWRNLLEAETSIYGRRRRGEAPPPAPDFSKPVITCEGIESSEENGTIVVKAKSVYKYDEKNTLTVDYLYHITSDSQIKVHYEMYTSFSVPAIPEAGMRLKTADKLSQLKWFGLGPGNTYPNKRISATLGLWDMLANSNAVVNVKETRWIKCSFANHTLRINSKGYLRNESDEPTVIYILSSVLSRPDKSRAAGDPFPKLLTSTGEPFVGEFCISFR